ncbi:PAS domain-containing protein [Thalassotalea sp. M1531]|uniref:histidine kinase n=1 Tax=Thalassotalea algicola TaxID=2716224 RepID=A0A7Y0LBB0_9GAMM|nr:ATP-binding protein [Thalassotalea algicola]NMP31094.1 PAS domain-containing protein [Thalassotalea algicola]
MGFKRFSLFIIIRTALAMVSLLVLSFFLTNTGYHAASIVMTLLLAAQLAELVSFVSKTNAELVRFFEAARHADYSQRFDLSRLGSGFDELGKAFGDILSRLQIARNQQEETLRHVKAVVEHVPVPLMSIQNDGQVTLWNNSARRLFGTHPVINIDDLSAFNSNFPKQLLAMAPGERSLINMVIDDMQHQLSIAATEIVIAGQKELLISLQDIQSELDAAQLEAWQDLVRVLTHEIMNSITPVASLANTAADLVDDVKAQVDEQLELKDSLSDVSDAVKTVARRSDSLMNFVTSYRQLTRLPEPNKTQVLLTELFDQVTRIACTNWPNKAIDITTNIEPKSLSVTLDRDMIEQVLINLLKNAEHAVQECNSAAISLTAYLNLRGHIVIDVSDNGVGISEEVAEKVFVPFFTTKREGSGVGLALTRQVMLAHGGHVSLHSIQGKGSKFSLTF